jgi:hypothetical protein
MRGAMKGVAYQMRLLHLLQVAFGMQVKILPGICPFVQGK